MRELLRSILRRIDMYEDPIFPFDDVRTWPRGTLDWLIAAGVVRETNRARETTCGNCADGCWVTPDVVEDPSTGKLVCHCWCHDLEEGGLVKFSPDRLRQWEPHFEGLARFAARQLDTAGDVTAVVPGRVYMIGALITDGVCRDVFLARGLTWPDAAEILDRADRLQASALPVVLVPDQLPPLAFWKCVQSSVVSLSEALIADDSWLGLDRALLLARIGPAVTHSPETEALEHTSALTRTESDVLESLAASPNEAMLLVDLEAAAGYGKKALRAALTRLVNLGLVAKPTGTKRKGAAITPMGLAIVERANVDSANT